MNKLGRYLTSVGIGSALLLETIFGSGCTVNMAKRNFAISAGMDASDVNVDPQTGRASTKYPNKPVIVPGYGYNPYYNTNYNPTLYNTWPPAGINYPYVDHSDVGSVNGPNFRSRFYR